MFKKVKTTHHILNEFKNLLLAIEKHPLISRIIPGRIDRQQKGTSHLGFKICYQTSSGLKCLMTKGATAQEIFIVCPKESVDTVKKFIQDVLDQEFNTK